MGYFILIYIFIYRNRVASWCILTRVLVKQEKTTTKQKERQQEEEEKRTTIKQKERQQEEEEMEVIITRSSRDCERTFSYIGPVSVTWNSLPFTVRHAQTLPSFKSQLKTYLFCQSK